MAEAQDKFLDLDNSRFWEDCEKGLLSIQRCGECGKLRFPPRIICPVCLSDQIEWVVSSGRGTVYSWVTVHHPPRTYLKDEVPYNLSLIELDEGVRLWSRVIGCSTSEVKVGLPVKVMFAQGQSGAKELTLPLFEPV